VPLRVDGTDIIRPKEAAALSHCSVGTIYVWMGEKRFKHWEVKQRGRERGLRYIDRSSFMEFLAKQREEALAAK
jgi:predicted mannosyl-3-phosphoglycerate phosphatase (HAD superfamily)